MTLARIQQAHAQGRSYHAIAEALNADGVPTARGGRWYASTIRQLVGRLSPRQERKVA